jgi:hypothetical protein
VASPNPSSRDNEFYGVSDVSSSNAWVVGGYVNNINGVNVNETLILHWNGTTWKEAVSPSPSSRFNVLLGVSADSAGDAWAAGYYALDRTLILHWNGSAWVKT